MTTDQLANIYDTACRGKGYEPNDPQFKLWRQTLGWSEEADLAQALVWWFTDNSAFPMPADLLALSGRARRERIARSQERTSLVRWECPGCGVHASGFISAADQRVRTCGGIPRDGRRGLCGATLQIVYDERPQAGAQYYQQQVCPKCEGVVGMQRPVGEQFRTWCLPCQSQRKIIPEDLELTGGEWDMICAELALVYNAWVARGSKPWDNIDPQFDRELVRGRV